MTSTLKLGTSGGPTQGAAGELTRLASASRPARLVDRVRPGRLIDPRGSRARSDARSLAQQRAEPFPGERCGLGRADESSQRSHEQFRLLDLRKVADLREDLEPAAMDGLVRGAPVSSGDDP